MLDFRVLDIQMVKEATEYLHVVVILISIGGLLRV